MKILKRVFTGEIKAINELEKTLTAYISTKDRDRMDEVLLPKGADLKKYNKNPVVLFAHDYSKPPIGKALWTKKDERGIISKVQFANTEFAQEIFELYKGKFMNAFSVGFIPKKWENGDGEKNPIRTYLEWEMLEFSAVPVPANAEALTLAVQKGILKNETLKNSFIEDEGDEDDNKDDKADNMEDVSEESGDNPKGSNAGESGDNTEKEPVKEEEKTEEESSKEEIKEEKALDDLLADIDLLVEKNDSLNAEVKELRLTLYKVLMKNRKKTIAEITDDELALKVGEVINGVIRQVTGKVS